MGSLNPNGSVDNLVTLTLMSKPENVAFARAALAMFASQLDFTVDEIDEIKVAVSEAVSNAVIHGYNDGPGEIFVEAILRQQSIEIVVRDTGKGIADIEWASEATNTSRPEERMGLGLVFMREYMDEIEIDSKPNLGTTIRMTKSPRSALKTH